MKISLSWLGDFLEWKETDPQLIADRITVGVAEVEEVLDRSALLKHCCVGKVVSVAKHPNADTLLLATVETDDGVKNIVCGGTNLREGMLCAFAHIDATVKWHGAELMTLSKTKIRGEVSEGMICAGEELGLESMFVPKKEDGERPIADLSDVPGISVGQPLAEALGCKDTVLDFSNTSITHRPDLFSHIGFARECNALGLAVWKGGKEPSWPLPEFPETALPFTNKNDIPDLVPRYQACLLEIDALGQTPDWMVKRLESVGLRSVSLPVDITNYVSLETGMPLHSFDADDFAGDIHFRTAKKGEKITTLDNQERELPEGAIVLSDDEGIFDLLGIMGGLRSSTKESTKRIYLHSAAVDPASIRKAILATGHRTDASTTYEKGVPRITVEVGFARALHLFLELVPGAKVASKLESWDALEDITPIAFSTARCNSMLGSDISAKEMEEILTSLGCTCKKTDTGFDVTPPHHRIRDLNIEEDLIEEVGRMYGYDKIPDVLPTAPVRLPPRDTRKYILRSKLKEEGCMEILPLSFTSPLLLAACGMDPAQAIEVKNPIGEDTSLMQPSVLPNMLAHAKAHFREADDALHTFSVSNVFAKTGEQHEELGMLHIALQQTDLRSDPFLRTKMQLLSAMKHAGYPLEIEPSNAIPPIAHPGRFASLTSEGKEVGCIFELHPLIAKKFDFPFRSAAALLDLSLVFEKEPEKFVFTSTSPFPAVTYDLTVSRTHEQNTGKLLTALRNADPLVESVEVADIYAKDPSQPFNLTLRCTYRANDRTLKEDEVKAVHKKIEEIATKE